MNGDEKGKRNTKEATDRKRKNRKNKKKDGCTIA